MEHVRPRLLVAGTHSGVGKTTLCAGLAVALQRRGLSVCAFKVGPDYLDPTYLRAAGVRCHTLDAWMMGEPSVLRTFLEETEESDICLIEGMMGLFDGARRDSDAGSSAEIARWLSAPVILVADASAMAGSFGALVHGFASFDPRLELAAVIANRVGGWGHTELLRAALNRRPASGGYPSLLLGGVPAHPELAFPERHLGLEPASAPETRAQLDRWANVLEEALDLPRLLELARAAPPISAPNAEAPEPKPARFGSGRSRAELQSRKEILGTPATERQPLRLAVAEDAAFCFYYAENLRLLEQAGAVLVPFSPLSDRLPPVDALYFGGGYPELFASELSANTELLQEIRAHHGQGLPIYAECGGLMFMCQELQALSGEVFPMLGLLPARAVMQPRLMAIGYAEVQLSCATWLGEAGTRLRGHQFRHSALEWAEPVEECYRLYSPHGEEIATEGYRAGSLLASYVHQHWGRTPEVAERLVNAWRAPRGN